jgi:hypothetical protein
MYPLEIVAFRPVSPLAIMTRYIVGYSCHMTPQNRRRMLPGLPASLRKFLILRHHLENVLKEPNEVKNARIKTSRKKWILAL